MTKTLLGLAEAEEQSDAPSDDYIRRTSKSERLKSSEMTDLIPSKDDRLENLIGNSV